MPYEVVTTADEERGIIFASVHYATEVARNEGGEVWSLADDESHTRLMCVWPEEAARRHGQLQDEPDADVVPLEVRRIARTAAELVAAHPHTTYDEVVALVGYAYALGNRDGYAEAAATADAILAPLREAVGL